MLCWVIIQRAGHPLPWPELSLKVPRALLLPQPKGTRPHPAPRQFRAGQSQRPRRKREAGYQGPVTTSEPRPGPSLPVTSPSHPIGQRETRGWGWGVGVGVCHWPGQSQAPKPQPTLPQSAPLLPNSTRHLRALPPASSAPLTPVVINIRLRSGHHPVRLSSPCLLMLTIAICTVT